MTKYILGVVLVFLMATFLVWRRDAASVSGAWLWLSRCAVVVIVRNLERNSPDAERRGGRNVLLLLVAMLLFGAKRLPEIGRSLGSVRPL